jgi:hypothetical protein
MATKKKMLQAAAGAAGGATLDITDVFSTYLYTGNGSTQTIANGIDLDGEGGLVWIKDRPTARNHALFNAENLGYYLSSNLTSAEQVTDNTVTAFNSDGFSVGLGSLVNLNGSDVASWTFRKAPKFFDVVTYTGTGSARTVSHNLGTTVGSIIIKRTDTTSNWAVYHRGNTAAPETDFLSLNLTNATADDATYWNDTAPTDSVFTVGTNAAVNASGGTYVAYIFAHNDGDGEFGPDADADIIKCGSYTGNGSATGPEIDLGFEPQWVMVKGSTSVTGWTIVDNMRGMTVDGTTDSILYANASSAEDTSGRFTPKPDGFQVRSTSSYVNTSGQTYTYIAIRRGPLAPPEAGTEVFATDHRGSSAATAAGTSYYSGFPVDMTFGRDRTYAGGDTAVYDRLRGDKNLFTDLTVAEGTTSYYLDSNTGFWGSTQTESTAQSAWMWKRAPGFFDVVAYTGTSSVRTVAHNLGVTPELLIFKRRDSAAVWRTLVFNGSSWTGLVLSSTAAASTAALPELYGDDTTFIAPTDTVFTVGASATTNVGNMIAYLFATLAGVSKVGSYTGDGTSQTINAGFTTGARFILIKRTDSTGDWFIWDTVRGVIAGNDPHLSLNTTAAEVTSDDSIDPDSSGFIVNQVAATNINVSSATYIYYAVA